jgi:hypothetical protein
MPAARIFLQLIADFVVYLGLLIRRRKAIAAENLFLRRQLALYQERKVDPRRIDPATRITFVLAHRARETLSEPRTGCYSSMSKSN